jgi:hypothetical protein
MAGDTEGGRSAELVREVLKRNSAICSIVKDTQIPFEQVVSLIKESDRLTELVDGIDRETHQKEGTGRGNYLYQLFLNDPRWHDPLNDARELLGKKGYNWNVDPEMRGE